MADGVVSKRLCAGRSFRADGEVSCRQWIGILYVISGCTFRSATMRNILDWMLRMAGAELELVGQFSRSRTKGGRTGLGWRRQLAHPVLPSLELRLVGELLAHEHSHFILQRLDCKT